jgi:heptosyltransferase II
MKILIELPTWIGDTVMVTPSIENIIAYYGNPEITIIGSIASIEILKNHPQIVKAEVLKKDYLSLLKFARILGQFDVYFSFRDSFRSKILKLFLSSKNKYQYKRTHYQNFHQVLRYNHFISNSLNNNFIAGELVLYQNSAPSKNKSSQILGVNPGASYGSSKRWYPKEFAELAYRLSNEYDILIFGGADERDIANDIERYLIEYGVINYENLAGKTTVGDLIKKISNLDLFITGDSGPMHIAAAFKVPTIAIFGPTNENETSQWMNPNSALIKHNLLCQPCMKRTCPLRHHNCMKLIKAIDVIKEVKLIRNELRE